MNIPNECFALVNLHVTSKKNVLRKKLNLYPIHVIALYTALIMHVLTIALQDIYAFHTKIKSLTYYVCCLHLR